MFESFNIESVTKVYKNTEEGVLVLEFYESEEVEKLLEMAET